MPGLLERYHYWQRPSGVVDYVQSVLDLSPVAFWGMQEASGNVSDLTGNGWTGTANGTLTYSVAGPTINGESFDAITFDGTSGYLGVSSTLTDPSTGGFTVSAWYKAPHDAAIRRGLFWSNSTGEGTFYLRLGHTTDAVGAWGVTINTVDAVHGQALSTNTPDDTWKHIGLRYDSGAGVLRVYHDGSTFDDTSFDGTWKRDGDPTCTIGSGGGTFFDGEIALLAYWDSVLTDANMTSLRTGEF
jgi:hypothetical protein